MKIRMYFGVVKTVLICAVLALALALVGLNIAMLAGAKGVATTMPAVAAASLAASAIIAAAALLLLFNSYYKFADDKLVIVFGIFKDVVTYEDITAIRQDGSTKDIYLFSKGKRIQDGETVVHFSTHPSKVDDILAAVRKVMPDMIIEVFTPEHKEPKH